MIVHTKVMIISVVIPLIYMPLLFSSHLHADKADDKQKWQW